MFLVYKPEGQPEKRWHFAPGRLRTAEMIAIEKRTGVKWAVFVNDLLQGGVEAIQALLWTYQRREHHTLRCDDVDFYGDEVQLVKDKDELAEDLRALEEDFPDMPADQRLAGIAVTRVQMRTAPDAPGKAPAPTPADEPMDWPAPEAAPMPLAYPAP